MLIGGVWVEGYDDEALEEVEREAAQMRQPDRAQTTAQERAREDAKESAPIGVRNKKLGKRGEDAAERYLRYLDYEILERNWECPFGEADIIAREGDAIVFVEVKTRKTIDKGFPSEAVTPKKRARYEKIAAWYLKDYNVFDVPVRFDVIGILVLSNDRAMIKHYRNAFGFEH